MNSLHYTGLTLDRSDHLRRDEDKISKLWDHPTTRVYPLHKLKNLVDPQESQAIYRTQLELREGNLQHPQGTFIGLDGNEAVFVVSCTDQQAGCWQSIVPGSEFSDLRQAGPTLPRDQASILGVARGILHWQQQTPYCSLCGSQNRLSNGGHMMRCSSDACSKQTFPRTDPAVIMLIERMASSGERYCLLGRSHAWPQGVYSTLAGFVETGESLEEAVAREVFEEASIHIKDVRYLASQPWPFPQSIMLGFIATATTDEIQIDPVELAEARWFSDKEIATFGDWGDQAPGPKLPRPDSIARFLIDSWMKS